MPPNRYTVTVSDQKFILTQDQLESEPGNYFATYFLGDFSEASSNTKELIVEKEPLIFKFIQAHLRGYSVFPIPDAYVPDYMTRRGMLENLLLDAQYFGLSRLELRVREEIDKDDAKMQLEAAKPVVGGQRVYQLWNHRYMQGSNQSRVTRPVALSPDALRRYGETHEQVTSNCEKCYELSTGWELEMLLREKNTDMTARDHYVVESRLI